MSQERQLLCPHCAAPVELRFLQYASIRPGWLYCTKCGGRLVFPFGVRMLAVMLGILVGMVPLAIAHSSSIWDSGEFAGIALKAGAFIFSVGLMMATVAFVCYFLAKRFVK